MPSQHSYGRLVCFSAACSTTIFASPRLLTSPSSAFRFSSSSSVTYTRPVLPTTPAAAIPISPLPAPTSPMVCPAFHPITCPRRRTSSLDACAPKNRRRDSAAITSSWRILTRAWPRCQWAFRRSACCRDQRNALGFVGAHQRQELVARLLVVPERSQHRAGHRLPVLFLHSAHLHAQVPRLNDHSHA